MKPRTSVIYGVRHLDAAVALGRGQQGEKHENQNHQQTFRFNAAPGEVYELLMDSNQTLVAFERESFDQTTPTEAFNLTPSRHHITRVLRQLLGVSDHSIHRL
jgi:hypothetical protein